ncbi:TOTE conflict system archaeo-eukaryotic primase domain-containing protein [Propionivibrio sp.]|uniref:TOTE conflict system archaeo-eukaryotic primase domain-containing protein n=1 Tax=Propionivibrio sp. TaxID=2212460 RepID=UPI003BF16CE4
MIERDQLTALQKENARLIALLEDHGVEWRLQPEPTPIEPAPPVPEPESSRLSTAEKVALFRRLFRGRTDVYPIRWESKTTGKSGYAPACGNEWLAGVLLRHRTIGD